MFTKDAAGAWQAVALVEPDGGSIEAPFRAAYPQITIERPAGAATLSDSLVEGLADFPLLVDREWIRDALWMLNDRKALVLYGPPGTGKTYIAQRIAEALQSDANRRGLVQLHPSYGFTRTSSKATARRRARTPHVGEARRPVASACRPRRAGPPNSRSFWFSTR
ncbi:MAG: AAA family ATPase [Deltaproteobacteria bacterium]|nr:AAA family ATPase [Deltaproteobacteria bacterium]